MGKGKSLQLEKGRINPRQFMFLIVTTILSTADVFLPYFIAEDAGPDSWISVLIAITIGIGLIVLLIKLGSRYPNDSLIQYSRKILGKFFGTIFSLFFIFYTLYVAWTVTIELGEIMVVAFHPEIPVWVFMLLIMSVAFYAVYQGLEVFARVNEILLPAGLVVLLLVLVSNVSEMDFKYMLPVMAKGIFPSIRGAIVILGWFCESVVFLQIFPNISQKNKILRYGIWAYIILGISLLSGTLIMAVFGPLTAKLIMPALEYARFAQIGEYIQNLDIAIIGIWITGIFIKIAIFYYVAVLSIAQLINLKKYKSIVLPIGIFITTMSLTASGRLADMLNFIHYIFPFFSLNIGFFFPLFMCVLICIRNINNKNKNTIKGF